MKARERIDAILEYKSLSQNALSREIGLTPMAISKISRDSNDITKRVREGILRRYPEIDEVWLTTGYGTMLKDGSDVPNEPMTEMQESDRDALASDARERINAVISYSRLSQNSFARKIGVSPMSVSRIGKATEEISKGVRNGIVSAFPEIDEAWLVTGKGEMLKPATNPNEAKKLERENIIAVPIVSTYASAGFLRGYADIDYINALPLHYTMKTRNKVDMAFEVSGDSMDCGNADSILNGDVVLCSEVDLELLCGLSSRLDRYVFVIVHTDGIVVKKIAKMDERTMTLHSLNPLYKNYDIRLADIRKVYRVVKVERELF